MTLTPKEHFHGSDLEKIEAIYGIKKEDIISFSANVNPLGISYRLRNELSTHLDAITSYPDREYTSLRQSLASYVQTDAQNILVGNGSTELIALVIQYIHPKKALIVAPTYSEYEHEISICKGELQYFPLQEEDDFALNLTQLEEALCQDVDMLILCNPNNPTSTQIDRKKMTLILDTCRKKDIFVMIDETYVEFCEEPEEITSIPLVTQYHNMIILRGISKFFAAPGLRLGYAICGDRELLSALNHKKNPWTINSLAAVAGEIMFQDSSYIQQTRQLIQSERSRICHILDDCHDIHYYHPHANFILLHLLNEKITSDALFDTAIRQGLMIRDCSTFPFLDNHFIRFCFMMPEDNNRLLQVLRLSGR
jgi:threonine-phosphate decarboxylase